MAIMGIFAPVRRAEPAVSNALIRRFCQLVITYLTTGMAESTLDIPLAQLRNVLFHLHGDAFASEDGAWDDIGPATKQAFAEVYGTEGQEIVILAVQEDLRHIRYGFELPEDRKSKLVKFLQKLSLGIPVSNQ